MPPRLKIVAEEILMCGLKSIPVAGKAFEVIDAVRSRHAMLAQTERLEGLACPPEPERKAEGATKKGARLRLEKNQVLNAAGADATDFGLC